MTSTVRALAVAIAIVGALAHPVWAEEAGSSEESVKTGSVGCGGHACVDVWKFQCPASSQLHAAVKDPLLSYFGLTLTLVGSLPAAIKGKADIVLTPAWNTWSPLAELNAPVNTTIQGFAIVSGSGESDYTLDLHCHKKDGTTVQPGTVTLIQNQ